MRKKQDSTIREVAALAGVSIATVSRAMQHPDKVRKATRDRVFLAAEKVNFVPNANARSFRRQSNNTIILVVRDISNPFYLEIFKGVEEAATEAGYKVLMGDARNDESRIENYVEMAQQKQADGLILMIGNFPKSLAERLDWLPPIVLASETVAGVELPTVKVDNITASRNAVRYLVEQGHQRIAHISGPLKENLTEDRLEGYRLGLSDAQLPYDDELVTSGDFGIETGRDAVSTLLAKNKPFTAIFAASDQMAIGAISELRNRGLSVPNDVSIIGFDDIVFASAMEPPLTTVRQPLRAMGRHAMEMMVGILNENDANMTIELSTELIVRGSVATLPSIN